MKIIFLNFIFDFLFIFIFMIHSINHIHRFYPFFLWEIYCQRRYSYWIIYILILVYFHFFLKSKFLNFKNSNPMSSYFFYFNSVRFYKKTFIFYIILFCKGWNNFMNFVFLNFFVAYNILICHCYIIYHYYCFFIKINQAIQ